MVSTLLNKHNVTVVEKPRSNIEIIGSTDAGRVREHNEDNFAINESLGLVVLADGMGGYQAGEVASEMAVKMIMAELAHPLQTLSRSKRYLNSRFHLATVLLEQAILKANQKICEMAEQQLRYRGMGTTVVAAIFHQDFISIAHVGDSRLYRLRGREFRQLTKDHSVRQELIDCGLYTLEQARHSPHKNLVTRALGSGKTVNVEIQESHLSPKDIYLLCSDGLSDMLDDAEIQAILTHHKDSLKQAASSLIEAANEKGGKDNISLILVRPLSVTPRLKNPWFQKLFRWRD